MTRIPLGERTVLSNSTVNVPAKVERYGFPREGKVEAYYDPTENAVVYTPVEEAEIDE